MKWEVELQGSRDSLRDILDNFPSYESMRYRRGFSVGMEEGQVLLKADRFETCTDVPNEVVFD